MSEQCPRCFGRGYLPGGRKPSKRNPNGLGFYARNCSRCGGSGTIEPKPKPKPPEVTRTVFRMFKGEVVALFPDISNDGFERRMGDIQSYQHAGQHGPADYTGVMRDSRPATPEEYAPLQRELESAPFNYKLRVVKRR